MLYMVGKIFLYEISFNIVYNESGHKNITFFLRVEKKTRTAFIEDKNVLLNK